MITQIIKNITIKSTITHALTPKENNPKFVQEQLEISLEAVTKELAEHTECGGGQNGK